MLASPHIALSGGGPFSPLDIASGCKLWLRGSLGVTVVAGNVTAIADQSGNANNVTAVGNVPYVASALNGQPGWSFSAAANNYLTNTTANLFAAGNARSIFVVAVATSEVGGPLLESRHTSINSTYFAGGSSYVGFPSGIYTNSIAGSRNATLSATITIGSVPIVYEITCGTAVATPTFAINGTTKAFTQTLGCDAETGTTGFDIGRWQPSISSYTGTMVEVIVFDSVLSAAKLSLVRGGLGALYGIPVI